MKLNDNQIKFIKENEEIIRKNDFQTFIENFGKESLNNSDLYGVGDFMYETIGEELLKNISSGIPQYFFNNGVVFYNVNPNNINSDLFRDYVGEEFNKIIPFFEAQGLTDKRIILPTIQLSNKKPRDKVFGKLDEKSIVKNFFEWLDNNMDKITSCIEARCELALCLKRDFDDYVGNNKNLCNYEKTYEDMTKCHGKIDCCEKAVWKEIDKLLRQKKITMKVWGEFDCGSNQIIIYYNNIFSNGIDMDDKESLAIVSAVLAHEYFHAAHYQINPSKIMWNYNKRDIEKCYSSQVMLESFADMFSYIWSINKRDRWFDEFCKERRKTWEEQHYSYFPYAKALDFFIVDQDLIKSNIEQLIKQGRITYLMDIYARDKFKTLFITLNSMI